MAECILITLMEKLGKIDPALENELKIGVGLDKATPTLDTVPDYEEGQKTMTYAGVGSRETPPAILKKMTAVAAMLSGRGYKLQSGGAIGADMAFEGKPYPEVLTAGANDVVNNKGKVVLKAGQSVTIGTKDYTNAYYVFSNKNNAGQILGSKWVKNSPTPNTKSFNGWAIGNDLTSNNKTRIDMAIKAKEIAKELHPNWGAMADFGQKLMARNNYQVFGPNLDKPVDFVLFYAEESDNPLRPKGGTGQAVEAARRKGIPTINMAEDADSVRKQIAAAIKKGKTINGPELKNDVYSKLGSKTVSGNVVIEKVYQKKGIARAKEIGGVFSLRVDGSDKHFGNPFSSVPAEIKKGLIATKDTRESVEKYIEWVLNSQDDRAKWIRSILDSGKLKGKPVIYYKELGEPSHATALDYMINNWESGTTAAEYVENSNTKLNYKDIGQLLKTYGNDRETVIGDDVGYVGEHDTKFTMNYKNKIRTVDGEVWDAIGLDGNDLRVLNRAITLLNEGKAHSQLSKPQQRVLGVMTALTHEQLAEIIETSEYAAGASLGVKNIQNQKVGSGTNVEFDKELNNKLIKILNNIYPEINLTYTTEGNEIKGQADLDAKTVLINSLLQSQDTLPHEYAHHYIAMFRDTEIVRTAIKEWGSEEKLVQAIGEEVVTRKGKALNWWDEFVNWILGEGNHIRQLDADALKDVLTEAFLSNINLHEVYTGGYDGKGMRKLFDTLSQYRYRPKGLSLELDEFITYADTIFPKSSLRGVYSHGTIASYNNVAYSNGEDLLQAMHANDPKLANKYLTKIINSTLIKNKKAEERYHPSDNFDSLFHIDSDNRISPKSYEYAELYGMLLDEYVMSEGWQWTENFSRKFIQKGIGGNYEGDNFYFAPAGDSAFHEHFLVKLDADNRTDNKNYRLGHVAKLEEGYIEAMVTNPEQIHIFGSDKDIEMLQRWKKTGTIHLKGRAKAEKAAVDNDTERIELHPGEFLGDVLFEKGEVKTSNAIMPGINGKAKLDIKIC